MTMREYAKTLTDEKTQKFVYLYERWQDEKEYEDFADYKDVLVKSYPEAIKVTQRPFGYVAKFDDGNLHVMLKRQGNYLRLCWKQVK